MSVCIKEAAKQDHTYDDQGGGVSESRSLITRQEATDELHSLLAMLEHSGPCTDEDYENEKGAVMCVYVKEDHEGCAIGRRMTPQEKERVLSESCNGDSVSGLTRHGCIPAHFERWDEYTLEVLQGVHDTYPHSPDEHLAVSQREAHRNAITDYEQHILATTRPINQGA